jgi:hypothetical protein
MLDLEIIKEKPEELTFEFAGEKVTGTCYPFKVTPTYLAELRKLSGRAAPAAEQAAEGEGQQAETPVKSSDAQMIHEIVGGWDVVAGGKPFPPTIGNLLGAPISFLAATALAILELVGKLSTTSESKS